MAGGRWNLLILVLHLSLPVTCLLCPAGFSGEGDSCIDEDECKDVKDPCGNNANCKNSVGSFYCQCLDGFSTSSNKRNFSADSSEKCQDINECLTQENICGPHAYCQNTIPHYFCTCKDGFISTTGNRTFSHRDTAHCQDICEKTICGNGFCHHGASGHECVCDNGSTNYGNKEAICTALNCDVFEDTRYLKETFPAAHELVIQLKENCMELTQSKDPKTLQGKDLLQSLLSFIDAVLSSGAFAPPDNRKVSTFLDLVELAVKFIGPLMTPPGTNRTLKNTELKMLLHQGPDLPQGAATLSLKRAQLDIQMKTAAGDSSSYPGFTAVTMLRYSKLGESQVGFYSGMRPKEKERYQINSEVVTVAVSNPNTSNLQEPVKLTLHHLEKRNNSTHVCVFWDSSLHGGTWSPDGCDVVQSNSASTVCSCNHLSSFAVLLAVYDFEDKFELKMISQVGLSLSLICLFICILTFWLIHSIQSPRTTIHLHLCISLFIAILIFLIGIASTKNKIGCAVVAGLLHFFFLAAFCWMCLEGIQLFRMVVLVFNTNFKTLYMMAGGYGVPAVIVAISALVNAKGYGTEKHCWLSKEFIWSFYGPVCVIIIINIFFFLITVWKLAQKFSSLNPDLNNLQKIKAFTITAVAQLCVLGTMWIFGCFQFDETTIVMSYLFTIFGSLQGVMLFVMHCLFSKQVREEYGHFLSRCCAPKKKRYSEFSSSASSKALASKSSHDTGESRI